MTVGLTIDEDLVRGLPLPLAQLYRRAHNAKNSVDRHQTAYYLWEGALKLLGSVAVVAYVERGPRDPKLDERLKNLARPAVGHWWEFARTLIPRLAEGADSGIQAVRAFLLGHARDDLPRAAGLDAALRQELEGVSGARSTVRPSELFDRLVAYRNREIGHGAFGERPSAFYDRMGWALLGGVSDLLSRLDVLAGWRLVAVTEVRRLSSGAWLVDWYELVGESARKLEPLEVPEAEAGLLPRPDRVYLLKRPEVGENGRKPEHWSLHPLVLFEPETAEVFFLSAQRGQRRAEYLCYSTGRVVDRTELGSDQRALLARILGGPVEPEKFESWVARSHAEEPAAQTTEPDFALRKLGEFDLLSELGRGGMGVVYRAWQPSLGRQVALKSLLRAGDPRAEARFTREIHALGMVDNPHLVKIYTSGAIADQWFYAMELVEGATLAAVCDTLASRSPDPTSVDLAAWQGSLSTAFEQSRHLEKPLSNAEADAPRPSGLAIAERSLSAPARAVGEGREGYVHQIVSLMRQVAEAAHALHEAGVVHRDIKPGNIILTADGTQAILMDLGLAQLADEAEGRLTRTRQFVGTLRYASPEQILAVGRLDRRSDVYSLGATLWELLTLRPLFGANEQTPTPVLMQRIQFDDPGRLRQYHRGIAPDLEAIVTRCLEKDPRRRYATALELADDLGRWQRGELVAAQPLTLGYVAGKFVRRHRWPIATAAALLLAAIAGTGAAFYRIDQARQDARAAASAARAEGNRAIV
ncbi:MAG TPA: serine/threonine-protein kinase, partial [Isosphaeraceae bacterium]|nr:serine/threonine-protein kinase [Isosphaeraceae bacterium]